MASDSNAPAQADGNKCILYIEDNAANTALMEMIIKRIDGVYMLAASSGAEGIEVALRENPQVILLDVGLPDMDGFQVLERLRSEDATRETPVLGVSAAATEADLERAASAQFDTYVTKPIDVREVTELLLSYLPPG